MNPLIIIITRQYLWPKVWFLKKKYSGEEKNSKMLLYFIFKRINVICHKWCCFTSINHPKIGNRNAWYLCKCQCLEFFFCFAKWLACIPIFISINILRASKAGEMRICLHNKNYNIVTKVTFIFHSQLFNMISNEFYFAL